MAKVFAGPQNEELEAALSSKFEPVKAPKSAELRKDKTKIELITMFR